MNYIFGMLALLAIVICIATFPIPTLAGLLIAALWWIVKGRKGRVR